MTSRNLFKIWVLIILVLFNLESSNANSVSKAEWSTLEDIFSTTFGIYWIWKPIADGNHWNFTDYQFNDPCGGRWQGVSCACSLPANNCTISDLALGNYNLSGQLPTKVGNLTNLKFLNLSANNIGGKLFPFRIDYGNFVVSFFLLF